MIREILARTTWLTAGSLVGRAFPLLVLIGLGAHIPTADYAAISLAFLWGAVAYSVLVSGLSSVVVRQIAAMSSKPAIVATLRRAGIYACVASLLPVMVVLLVGGPAISMLLGGSIPAPSILPGACAGAAWSMLSFAVSMLNGLHSARQAAVCASLSGLFQGAGLLAGAMAGAGPLAAVWGLAVGNALAAALALLAVWKILEGMAVSDPFRPAAPASLISRSLLFATLAAALVTPINFLAAQIAQASGGARELASFMALEQLHQLAVYVPNVLAMAILPLIARSARDDARRLARRLAAASVALAAGMTGVALVAGLFAADIMRLIGNPALDDVWAMRLMMVNAGLALSLSIQGSGIVALAFFGRGLIGNLIWAVLFLGLGTALADQGVAALQGARLVASLVLVLYGVIVLWFCVGPARTKLADAAQTAGNTA